MRQIAAADINKLGRGIASAARGVSLLAEGHTVGTLILGRIGLVGAHHDLVQGAVVAGLGMVGALLDGTLNALVGVHQIDLLCFGFQVSITGERKVIHGKKEFTELPYFALAICGYLRYDICG